jgi:hypothetical protein
MIKLPLKHHSTGRVLPLKILGGSTTPGTRLCQRVYLRQFLDRSTTKMFFAQFIPQNLQSQFAGV